MSSVWRVLFFCDTNRCRSQLAEALLRHYGGNRFEVSSAGLSPESVHPLVLRVLEEDGIETKGLHAKSYRALPADPVPDYLIVLGDPPPATIPAELLEIPQRRKWAFTNPLAIEGNESHRLEAFRRVRDQIRERVWAWIEDLDQMREWQARHAASDTNILPRQDKADDRLET